MKIDTTELTDKQCRHIIDLLIATRELGYRDGHIDGRKKIAEQDFKDQYQGNWNAPYKEHIFAMLKHAVFCTAPICPTCGDIMRFIADEIEKKHNAAS